MRNSSLITMSGNIILKSFIADWNSIEFDIFAAFVFFFHSWAQITFNELEILRHSKVQLSIMNPWLLDTLAFKLQLLFNWLFNKFDLFLFYRPSDKFWLINQKFSFTSRMYPMLSFRLFFVDFFEENIFKYIRSLNQDISELALSATFLTIFLCRWGANFERKVL